MFFEGVLRMGANLGIRNGLNRVIHNLGYWWQGLAFSYPRYIANGKGNSRKELQRYQSRGKSHGRGTQWTKNSEF